MCDRGKEISSNMGGEGDERVIKKTLVHDIRMSFSIFWRHVSTSFSDKHIDVVSTL